MDTSTSPASIADLIETVNEHLEALNYVEDPRRVAGHTILALETLLEVVRKQQAEIERLSLAHCE